MSDRAPTRSAREGRAGEAEAPLRVLFVCGADFRSPTEKVVLGYALGLLDRGHSVLIAVRGDPATADAELAAGRPEGLEIFAYRFAGPLVRRGDRALAARFRPDVVHAFNPRFDIVRAVRGLNGATGAPVVVHFEDDEWGLAAGREADSALRKLGRWVALRVAPAYPPLWRLATRGTFAWTRRDAAALEAITPELASHVSTQLDRECAFLPPVHPALGSPPAAVEPDLPAVVEGRDVVVFTGAVFAPHASDFRLLLEAMGELKRRGGSACLLYAGASAPRFDIRAWAAAAGLGEEDFVELGYLGPAELQGLLHRATVLVQPGAPSEFNRLRLPSKLQSYLASGTPTVTFGCGAGELFEDRKEVLETHGGSGEELADRIGELLADENLRGTLREHGPRAAARLFDLPRNTETLIGIYRGAIGRQALRPPAHD